MSLLESPGPSIASAYLYPQLQGMETGLYCLRTLHTHCECLPATKMPQLKKMHFTYVQGGPGSNPECLNGGISCFPQRSYAGIPADRP